MIASTLISLFLASAVTEEAYCSVDGFEPATRQTAIVIDEHHIVPESAGQRDAGNGAWRQAIGNLLNLSDPSIESRFAPRERVTIFVAHRDGSGMTRVFSGCLPFYSTAERQALEESGRDGGMFQIFLGTGAVADAEDYARSFRNGLARALVEAAQITTAASGGESETLWGSTLVASMGRSPFLSLNQGVPRLILFSDLARFSYSGINVAEARRTARTEAEQLGLDFQRAELYALGLSTGRDIDLVQEAAEAFFLTSQAHLVGMSSAQGLPQFQLPPERVEFFQGRIAYPDGQYPVRMRLAIDRNGDAVNAWIAVQSDLARFTPFAGVLSCQPGNDRQCEFLGDRVFAQIWSDDPDAEPEFQSWMPFAGLREVEFVIDGDSLEGRAFDGLVDLTDVEGNALVFTLSRMPNGSF